jgi:hypothetical protein
MILLLLGPRWRGSLDGNAFVSPKTKESGGWMIDIIEFGG